MSRYRTSWLAASLCVLGAAGGCARRGADSGKPASAPTYDQSVYPPWSHGDNNPALVRGLEFTVPEVDNLPDFHGSLDDPQLVIFVGGNYYFAMAPLVKAFEAQHPDLRGKLYYITIPPGLLVKMMDAGNTITVGNMTWTVAPDVYAAGLKKVDEQIQAGKLVGPAVPYATNDLTIMVPKGNPAGISTVADLGKPDVRLVMPNPAWEGVARQIESTLNKAGGPALTQMVYDTKVKNGRTVLTQIHHRQSPLFLMQGRADAGITWKSEAIFQEEAGHPISHVDIPAEYNTTAVYAAAMVKGAKHPAAARAWLEFLRSPAALAIFQRYGFKPAPADAKQE
ncbi:MAG TPA: substrate-binding domain-containing protein [Gemmatimonadaceae bacterium]|nr:substrate-binding domain-containing protein [Gemmatimonadaceae bacterium]